MGPTDIEKALAWLIDNSEGVKGLRLDGEVMSWADVIQRYLPWWSADFMDREVARATGAIDSCPICGADIVDGICAVVRILGGHPDDDASGGQS